MATYSLDSIRFVRRPHKRIPNTTNTVAIPFLEKIGSFDLVPLKKGEFYNTAGQTFPRVDSGESTDISNKTIYLISDPDVGIMIPQINISEGFRIHNYGIDANNMHNLNDVNAYFDNVMGGDTASSFQAYTWEVCDYILEQPIFCHTEGVNGNWKMYAPRYKIGDGNVFYKEIAFNNFSDFFTKIESEEYSIQDVVISNKNIEDTRFSQMGICRNGISMKNGLRYSIDGGGNVSFNVGNIKSDITTHIYLAKGQTSWFNNDTGGYLGNSSIHCTPIQFNSSSYSKGEVVSGTSFTSVLSSIFSNVFNKLDSLDESTAKCMGKEQPIDGHEVRSVVLTESLSSKFLTPVGEGDGIRSFEMRLNQKIKKIDDANNTFSPKLKITFKNGNNWTYRTFNIKIYSEDNNGNPTYILPSVDIEDGYYMVQYVDGNPTSFAIDNYSHDIHLIPLPNSLYKEVKKLSNMVSNYDVLLIKK